MINLHTKELIRVIEPFVSEYETNIPVLKFLEEGISYFIDPHKCRLENLSSRNYFKRGKLPEIRKLVYSFEKAKYVERVPRQTLLAVSPINLVPKRNGAWRLVFDARKINRLFVPEKLQMCTVLSPFADLSALGGWWGKIDLQNAFLHFPLEKNFSRWFGFELDGAFYKFNRMPFGWNMAPVICQRILEPLTDFIYQKLSQDPAVKQPPQIFLFLDDILINAREKHVLEKTLKIFSEDFGKLGFNINRDKSVMQPKRVIEWLGFNISKKGVSVLPETIEAAHHAKATLAEFPTVQNLLSLIGILNWTARVCRWIQPFVAKFNSLIPTEHRVASNRHQIKA